MNADLAAFGIGVHHAGLEKNDRNTTEQLFLKRLLKVLFATSVRSDVKTRNV